MPQINTPSTGHAGPAPIPGGHTYLPYTDAAHLATLQRAIAIITTKIKGDSKCDLAFKSLPGKRTFAQVWADNSIWINFDPTRASGDFGAARGREITITAFALSMGHWTVAATLVHELAHVNGAPGTTRAAEATLKSCLLGKLENPNIIGKLIDRSNSRLV